MIEIKQTLCLRCRYPFPFSPSVAGYKCRRSSSIGVEQMQYRIGVRVAIPTTAVPTTTIPTVAIPTNTIPITGRSLVKYGIAECGR